MEEILEIWKDLKLKGENIMEECNFKAVELNGLSVAYMLVTPYKRSFFITLEEAKRGLDETIVEYKEHNYAFKRGDVFIVKVMDTLIDLIEEKS